MAHRIKTTSEITTGVREQVLTQSWSYLRDNFHKFSETNKIKVALALTTKNIPIQSTVDGNLNVTMMPAISINDKPKEYSLGDNDHSKTS